MRPVCDKMLWSRRTKATEVCLFAFLLLVFDLTQTEASSLTKNSKQDQHKEEPDVLSSYRPGRIVFVRVRTNSSAEDDADYQADDSGQTYEDYFKQAMAAVRCGQDHLSFSAFAPQSQFFTDRNPSLPLSQVPSSCGYNTFGNPHVRLVLIVPYDGCEVYSEDGCYNLPLRWRGVKVILQCPKPEEPPTAAPTSDTATVNPSYVPPVELWHYLLFYWQHFPPKNLLLFIKQYWQHIPLYLRSHYYILWHRLLQITLAPPQLPSNLLHLHPMYWFLSMYQQQTPHFMGNLQSQIPQDPTSQQTPTFLDPRSFASLQNPGMSQYPVQTPQQSSGHQQSQQIQAFHDLQKLILNQGTSSHPVQPPQDPTQQQTSNHQQSQQMQSLHQLISNQGGSSFLQSLNP